LDNERIKYYLLRKEQLQIPSIYRLFHKNLPDTRCIHSDVHLNNHEFLDFPHTAQGHFKSDYHFSVIANPLIGLSHDNKASSDIKEESSEEKLLKTTITQINKLRPKFLLVLGNFTKHINHSTVEHEDLEYLNQVQSFRRCMARVSDTIPIIFVPGDHEMGFSPSSPYSSPENFLYHRIQYQKLFGCDYFSFWYQGTKGIVINSHLLIEGSKLVGQTGCEHEELFREFTAQEEWLEEEIEQSKLCSNNILLFTYHPWYYYSAEEEDIDVTMTCYPYDRIR
jgi:hypothetical protein